MLLPSKLMTMASVSTRQTLPPFSEIMIKVSPPSMVSPESAICCRRPVEEFLGEGDFVGV